MEEENEKQKQELAEEHQKVAVLVEEIEASVNLSTYECVERERDRYLGMLKNGVDNHQLMAAIETKDEKIFNLTRQINKQDTIIASYRNLVQVDHNYSRH